MTLVLLMAAELGVLVLVDAPTLLVLAWLIAAGFAILTASAGRDLADQVRASVVPDGDVEVALELVGCLSLFDLGFRLVVVSVALWWWL